MILGLNCKNSTSANNDNPQELSGSYLGQTPPGMTPELFAPEALRSTSSWWWHGAPVFSPNGSELYFGKYTASGSNHIKINYMIIENSIWTSPEPETFSNSVSTSTNNPVFSINGEKLYFWSGQNDGGIFYINRSGSGWLSPQQLNIPVPAGYTFGLQFSLTANADIFLDVRDDVNIDIYRSEIVNDVYTTPVRLGSSVNTSYFEFSPYVSPDEDYLIFASNRPGGFGMNDLYICFKNPDGTWSEAKNMGSSINSNQEDAWPYVTHDGNYFFFVTKKEGDIMSNPYWVDASILDALR